MNYVSHYTIETKKQIHYRLYYHFRHCDCEKGLKPCVFTVKPECIGSINIDQSKFTADGKMLVFISDRSDYNIEEHLKADFDAKKYSKKYSKNINARNRIGLYLKRHNNSFNPKWTEEEKQIAENILSRIRNKIK